MNRLIALATATLLAGSSAALALEPIRGSLTYEGPVRLGFTKAPSGTTFSHSFYDSVTGNPTQEIYIINADRTITLLSRTVGHGKGKRDRR